MEPDYVCFQYQCPRHPRCALAGGTCCAVEQDHRKTPVREEQCSEGNGWPLFRLSPKEELKLWMKNPLAQV